MTARVQQNFCQHPGCKAHVRILKRNLRFINRSSLASDWRLTPTAQTALSNGQLAAGSRCDTEVPCAVVILRKCERMIRSTV